MHPDLIAVDFCPSPRSMSSPLPLPPSHGLATANCVLSIEHYLTATVEFTSGELAYYGTWSQVAMKSMVLGPKLQ